MKLSLQKISLLSKRSKGEVVEGCEVMYDKEQATERALVEELNDETKTSMFGCVGFHSLFSGWTI